MATKKKLLQAAAGQAGGAALNVEDVFSTYLWDGAGGTQTIVNGVDLTEGGLVWAKQRSSTIKHVLSDSERGTTKVLSSNSTAAESTETNGFTSFNSDGFTFGSWAGLNNNGDTYASWTFRKAPKFFDVVTYTGNGSTQNISHNLGSVPGTIIVKKTSSTANWITYHRSLGNDKAVFLNLTSSQSSSTTYWNATTPTDSVFSVGANSNTNGNSDTFVAYLFAHNDGDGDFGPTADQDIIKCGGITNAASGVNTIDLGFEAQWVMIKRTDSSGDWYMADVMRGAPTLTLSTQRLFANTSSAESADPLVGPHPTGFQFNNQWGTSSDWVYIAIRRGPMAVPESATDVFAIDTFGNASSTAPAWEAGFPVDMEMQRNISSTANMNITSRLTSGKFMRTNLTSAEASNSSYSFDYQNGWGDYAAASNTSNYSWMWKRAPNYFDAVAYTGTGSARTVSHNLGVVPEMMWVKRRSASEDWNIYHKDLLATEYLQFNTDAATTTNGTLRWNSTRPTDSVFSVGTHASINASGSTYIAYLFASVDGVSKVGSYTGDGTTDGSKVIDCGFSAGARFVVIKKTSEAGNWIVYDAERGIVSGNDSHLYLDQTSAEDTSFDSITPNNSGFAVNHIASNKSGVSYIFYAIA